MGKGRNVGGGGMGGNGKDAGRGAIVRDKAEGTGGKGERGENELLGMGLS